jgi:hypothetical protein
MVSGAKCERQYCEDVRAVRQINVYTGIVSLTSDSHRNACWADAVLAHQSALASVMKAAIISVMMAEMRRPAIFILYKLSW